MKPRVNWKFCKFRYLRMYPSWTLISDYSSKKLLSSVNTISLLVVLITSSVETIR